MIPSLHLRHAVQRTCAGADLRPAPRGAASTALVVMLLLFAPAAAAAQDCEIRYRAGLSNDWVFVSRTAGQSWTGTVNNLREIQNVGRNDFTVRTGGVGGIQAYNRLISNPGGGTIVLPPAVFTGLQLQRITCESYATVYDAGDYLTQFGSSAAQVVADAAAAAGEAVEDAQEEAAAALDQGVQQLVAAADSLYDSSTAAWQAFQDSVNAAGTRFPRRFAQAFPELQAALDATADYTYELPTSTTALWTSHVTGVRQVLVTLDASLGVSETVGEVLSIDMARAFPELDALGRTTCTLDRRLFDRLGQRAEQLERTLLTLQESAAALWPSEIADPFFRDLWALARRMAEPVCDRELADLASSLRRDRQAAVAFLQAADRALRAVDVRALARGQEGFGRAVTDLGTSTGKLMQLLLDQEQLEQAVEFRATEVRQAQQRLVGPTPDSGPAGIQWLSPDYWERRARQGDPDALAEDAQAVVTATERYERAVAERNDGWARVGAGWEQWTREAASLTGLVPRLRVDVRGIRELVDALSNPPALRTPATALSGALDCVSAAHRRLSEGATELARISAQLLAALRDALPKAELPPEIAAQLERALEATREAIEADRAVGLAGDAVMRDVSVLQASVVRLVATLSTDPGGPGYLARVDGSLVEVRRGASMLTDDRQRLEAAIDQAVNAHATHEREVMRLVDLLVPEESLADAARSLRLAIQGLEEDRRAALATLGSAMACSGELGTAAGRALAAHPNRLAAYLNAVGATLGEAGEALMPAAVAEARDDALDAAEQVIGAIGTLAAVSSNVATRANTFVAAYAAVNAAIASLNLNGLPARVIAARSAAQDLLQESQALLQASNALAQRQGVLQARLNDLHGAMVNAGLEAAWDAAGIAYEAVDVELLTAEYARAQNLAGAWALAAQATPGRVAAFVGVDATLASNIQQLLGQMQNALGPMAQCLASGQAARTAVLASSLRTQAVNTATQGLQAEVQGVINDLNSLLDPTQNLMSQLATIFDRAESLSDRLAGIQASATSSYTTLAQASIQELGTAVSCLQTRYAQVSNGASQVQAQLSAND